MLEILAGMLRTAAPILLAAMGGVVFEKSGVFTIAHEGIMLFGAFFGVLGVYLTASPLMGVAFALTAGAVCGLIYIWLTERMGANATIVSIGINTLAIGATTYMMKMIFGDAGTVGNPRIIGLPRISIPLFDRVPFLDKVLNNHTALVYVSLLLVAALHFLLFHTHLGISLRAVGEKPEAAAAAGIPVYRYRLAASVFAGMLCGLAGCTSPSGTSRCSPRTSRRGAGSSPTRRSSSGTPTPSPRRSRALCSGSRRSSPSASRT